MRRFQWIVPALLLSALNLSAPALAHYGMIIPTDAMVMADDPRQIKLTLSFSHPMEGLGMELVKPKAFGLKAEGKTIDLLGSLKPTKVMDQPAWEVDFSVTRPGLYVFFMEPQPYWEPAEDKFIVHFTKTVVAAFGEDEGWDQPIGLKTEIVPLSKPYGLYAGNVFQGMVLKAGKPIANAEVEVEFYNTDGKAKAPTDYMVTQTIKTDKNGVFTYAAPKPGWWGFAALSNADYKLKKDGKDKEVELGAVLWVQFVPWQEK